MSALFKRYDVPAPRYTSYPTVPYWSDSPSTEEWMESLKRTVPTADGMSLYVHVPFCETLCTFCGCNTSITKDHGHERPYVDLVLQELAVYNSQIDLKPLPVKQLHLGGGTPTFLSASSLEYLVSGLLKDFQKASDFEGSLEVDPRRTTVDQLEALRQLGFNRISLGVQDFNHQVQEIVNRVQPYEMTRELTESARKLGYDSVNFDLIYGLPLQTPESIKDMAAKTIELRPDRIALYSFALVPWIKPAQRLFKDEDVPVGEAKRQLYEIVREILLGEGYLEIGMDHFALPDEALSLAMRDHRLHRNFMGYTDVKSDILLGLGVSSISETPDCFHQNEKRLPVFKRKIESGEIATLRGHKLSQQDVRQRAKILQFMTSQQVELESDQESSEIREFLGQMLKDGLIEVNGRWVRMTEKGRPFLRNACMALDLRLREKSPERQVFSQSL